MARALCSGKIDFALFFSPRTAGIFVNLVSRAGLAACCRTITALSISPAADAALATLSWRDRYVAEKASQARCLISSIVFSVSGSRRHHDRVRPDVWEEVARSRSKHRSEDCNPPHLADGGYGR
jgi:hypothetical protein